MKVNDPNEAARYHLGTTIAGRYLVERPIGEGSMGAVALARHVGLGEAVAIKFLRFELRRDPAAIERLSREAQVLARIKSDHVARVFDVGATLAVGPYMVMEYLEGQSLGEVLDAEGPLPAERAVEVVLQACEALTVAHTAGIVHRDIKPQNLFLARHGRFETLKVLDFGIAHDAVGGRAASAASPAEAERAVTAPLYGTPSYMSPERIRNEPGADHRSDIWSVGVVLHELVTGRAIFDAPSALETCIRVVSDAPLELESADAVLPPALRSIIARCLERDPGRRYQSVEELAAALAPLASMQERFRGRSTGAFSRQLVQEQLALSKTQRVPLPTPTQAPPTTAELSSVLRDIGAALRWVVQGTLRARVQGRPLWLYPVVAASSAFCVLAATRIVGGGPWLAPPPAAVQGQSLEPGERHSVRGDDAAPLAAAPPALPVAADPSPPGDVIDEGRFHTEPPARPMPRARAVRSAERASSEANEKRSQRAARRRHRRATRAMPDDQVGAELGAANGTASERLGEAATAPATRATSRVRLVEDKLITNRSGEREPTTREHPLPDWLELMRADPDRGELEHGDLEGEESAP